MQPKLFECLKTYNYQTFTKDLIAGIIVAIIVLLVLGIKYMMGSAAEKAEYKKTMIPYIVGAALIFAASVFANVIYEFFAGI